MTLTPKQESFCQKYIETGNASEAYRCSFNTSKMKPETVNRAAKELIDHPKVSTRIKDLQQELQKRHEVTADSLTSELNAVLALAMENPKGLSAAVSAIMGKAKLHGIIIEKTKIEADTTINVIIKNFSTEK